ncbi:MAG: T9SS type A sorting domain-containing protein [Flavobacteriales bacterium]|nr:T9SS type A sorting domain-containing protein [Flavobacteriales bacterium]
MKKSLLTFSIVGLLVPASQAQTPLTTAVDFTVTTMDGDQVNLFNILDGGSYAVIDFMAYWCGPCLQTAPEFSQSYTTYGCNTGDVFFISIEADGTDEQTLAFEQDAGTVGGAPIVSGLGGGGEAPHTAYGISALPTMILVAPNRQIVNQDIWPFSASIMANLLTAEGLTAKSCNVGINDVESAGTAVVAFPNPSADRVSFRFDLNGSGQATIEVYDIMGQRVSVVTTDGLLAGVNTIELPVDVLAKGHYSARISAANGFVGQTRFSVMR